MKRSPFPNKFNQFMLNNNRIHPDGRRRGLRLGIAGVGGLSAGLLLLSGCPGPRFSADLPDVSDAGYVCGDSPWTNPITLNDNCAVFVSPTGDDVGGTGIQANPLRTLSTAIAKAVENKRSFIFACSGAFDDESLELPAGISLIGGFQACDTSHWTWSEGNERSSFKSPPNMIALRIIGEEPNHIESFRIQAGAAADPGASSIAVIAQPNAVLSVRNSELIAKDGADGTAGENAPADQPLTPDPDMTNEGLDACANATQNNGGFQHANLCPTLSGPDTASSIGGAGGDGFEAIGENGQAGLPNSPLSGTGGTGGAVCASGGAGKNGADGMPGTPGSAANTTGMLSISKGWIGTNGGDGDYGLPGQGGGGGAGQKGMMGCAGASGGAGGAGGCGGAPGKGGGAGGSSIALLSIDAKVTIDNVALSAGNGGKGGRGGDGQAGGVGAAGAAGGGSAIINLEKGCKGGGGGEGGAGGPGGGGAGGHSLGIAYKGTAPVALTKTIMTAQGGTGGDGGGNNSANNGGVPGQAAEQLLFEALSPN